MVELATNGQAVMPCLCFARYGLAPTHTLCRRPDLTMRLCPGVCVRRFRWMWRRGGADDWCVWTATPRSCCPRRRETGCARITWHGFMLRLPSEWISARGQRRSGAVARMRITHS